MDERIQRIIDEVQNRPVYESLDVKTLAGIADEKLEQAIIDFVDVKLTTRGADEDEVHVLSSLPAPVRALYLTWAVEAEVINGGFVRYYFSWMSKFADDTVAAFEFFSAYKHAHLLREANRVHTEETASSGTAKEPDTTETYFSTRLHVLEDRFYNLEESLSALRIAKVRADPSAFSVVARP